MAVYKSYRNHNHTLLKNLESLNCKDPLRTPSLFLTFIIINLLTILNFIFNSLFVKLIILSNFIQPTLPCITCKIIKEMKSFSDKYFVCEIFYLLRQLLFVPPPQGNNKSGNSHFIYLFIFYFQCFNASNNILRNYFIIKNLYIIGKVMSSKFFH